MKLKRIDQYAMKLSGKCPHCQLVASFVQLDYYPRRTTLLVAFSCSYCDGPVVAHIQDWAAEVPLSTHPASRPTFPDPEYETLVPDNIVAVMREVYAGVEVAAWALVGMGVRLVVELMSSERCAALGINAQQGLKARLRDLQQKYPALEGPIQLADTIRLLGNEVAHNHGFICGGPEAAVAIEMIEEMLGALYVQPARRQRLVDALPRKADALKPLP